MSRRATATSVVSTILVAIYATTPAYASDHEHREHDSHEHGVAQLNIAQEGNTLQVELETPAMNIVGFEHMPRNGSQHAAVEHAVAELEKGDAIFRFSAAANCKLMEARVESGLIGREHKEHEKEHEEHEAGDEDSHADFDVSYLFSCSQPDQLHSLTVRLFKLFPATEELEVQLISDRGQKRAHLTPSNSSLEF